MVFTFSSCSSSDDGVIAEVFIGNWDIFGQTIEGKLEEDAEGKMEIQFGNDVVTFMLEITENDETVISRAGIVYDDILYENVSREVVLGHLNLDNGILVITLEEFEDIAYRAIRIR